MKHNPGPDKANLMEFLLDAVCVVDAQGRFVSLDGAVEQIFGYRPEEMIGQPMIEFVYPEDRERTLLAAARIVAGHLQRYFENRYVRKDGSIVHIMWSARWSESGQVRVAVARDITDRYNAGRLHAQADTIPDLAPSWRLSRSPPRLIPPGFSPIPLSAQDYTVLLALATGGECVSRAAIVEALGEDFLGYDQRRLDTQMRRLRRKVEQACGLKLPVSTLRGAGYHFYDPIEVLR